MTPNDSTNPAARPSRAPTVLQVLPRLVTGGVERGTIEIAAALRAAGWTAVVASEGGPMVRELDRLDVPHVTLPLASKNPFVMRRNAGRLRQVIAAHGVDVVHARSRAPAWSALWAARAAKVPFVTTFHGTYNLGPLNLKRGYNAVMTKGDRVIAISEFIRRHMQDHYGVDDGKVRVVHRGVDFDRFDPDKVSAERMIQLAKRWHLPDGVPVVMLPGRLTRWKGQLLLVEALRRLKDLPFRCVLVGSDQGRTAYRAEVDAAIETAGLKDRVLVADDCRDMPAAYKLADVVVSASTDPEAFGRVSAEGLAMGRPVVAPAFGAAPEIVEHARTGWLFKPGDAASLAEMLRTALTLAPAARADLAARATEVARTRFSKDAMCAKTLAVYREVVQP